MACCSWAEIYNQIMVSENAGTIEAKLKAYAKRVSAVMTTIVRGNHDTLTEHCFTGSKRQHGIFSPECLQNEIALMCFTKVPAFLAHPAFDFAGNQYLIDLDVPPKKFEHYRSIFYNRVITAMENAKRKLAALSKDEELPGRVKGQKEMTGADKQLHKSDIISV